MFSLFIPKATNLIRFSAWHPDDETSDLTPTDTIVRIEMGELLTGILCKNTVGAKAGGLVHVIW